MNTVSYVLVNKVQWGKDTDDIEIEFERSNGRRYLYSYTDFDKANQFVQHLNRLCNVKEINIGVISGGLQVWYVPKLPPQEQASHALDEVCQWYKNGAPGNTERVYDWELDKPTAARHQAARKMAKAILKAAEVDGLHGCLLCQG